MFAPNRLSIASENQTYNNHAISLTEYDFLFSINRTDRYSQRNLQRRERYEKSVAISPSVPRIRCFVGLRCYDLDEHLQARTNPIIALWEDRFAKATPKDLRPITMVMYSAALLLTGTKRLLAVFDTNTDVQLSEKNGS